MSLEKRIIYRPTDAGLEVPADLHTKTETLLYNMYDQVIPVLAGKSDNGKPRRFGLRRADVTSQVNQVVFEPLARTSTLELLFALQDTATDGQTDMTIDEWAALTQEQVDAGAFAFQTGIETRFEMGNAINQAAQAIAASDLLATEVAVVLRSQPAILNICN